MSHLRNLTVPKETDMVENVWVENIVMSNAQNGARIKVFGGNPSPTSISGGGTGFVRSIPLWL